MYISARSLDDLLREVFRRLLRAKTTIRPTRGSATEITGALLQLTRPRARLSHSETKGTVFSCLGEFLWYLAKSKDLDFIGYYIKEYAQNSDDGKTIHGAYGPRLFGLNGIDQISNIVHILQAKPHSRQAVIQLFDVADIGRPHKDVPCTCVLQFMIRKSKLHMFTYMRSNDAYLGLPHDFFAFTMIQELLARTLHVGLGSYHHAVGSLHLYKRHRNKARQFLREGWQPFKTMPPMPKGDPWPAVAAILVVEKRLRADRGVDNEIAALDSYWKDLAYLLLAYRSHSKGNPGEISAIANRIRSKVYHRFLLDKAFNLKSKTTSSQKSAMHIAR